MSKPSAKTIELQEARSSLIRQLDGVDRELFKSRCDDAGLHLGDIVSDHKNEFIVRSISFWGSGSLSLEGCKRLKDGSFGQRSQYIGTQWKKVGVTPMQEAMQP